MSKIIKFTKRYEVFSLIQEQKYFEGSYRWLWRAAKQATKKAKIHGNAIVIDTKPNEDIKEVQ